MAARLLVSINDICYEDKTGCEPLFVQARNLRIGGSYPVCSALRGLFAEHISGPACRGGGIFRLRSLKRCGL
jgi:hypothetical protein